MIKKIIGLKIATSFLAVGVMAGLGVAALCKKSKKENSDNKPEG